MEVNEISIRRNNSNNLTRENDGEFMLEQVVWNRMKSFARLAAAHKR
jgi:hypothetical protein